MAIAKKPTAKTTPSTTSPSAVKPDVAAAPVAAKSAPVKAVVATTELAKVESTIPAMAFGIQPELLKPITDMQEQLRAGAEKSIEHMRSHYASMKGNAETATDKLEESIAAAQAGTRAFQTKMLDVFRVQADANFAHLRAVFSAASLTDAMKLQQDFAKAQVEAIQSETRTLTELAQKVANDVVEPVKASISASFAR